MNLIPALLFLAPWLPAQDPLEGQLPKRDLGAEAFLAAHPEYDGRGVRVAVLDTGVDPGHPLLQRTSTGGRKLVDWYDATTDGRLDTSWLAEATDGVMRGLSGRSLQLGRWDAPGRKFHLGRVDKDFLPGSLVGRVNAARKERWEREKRRWEEERTRQAAGHAGASNGDPAAAFHEQEEQQEWEDFEDPGPVYDVAVFHDGESWRVLIDSDEDGDLDEERALRPFRESGDWAVLGDEALLNYAVSVRGDGESITLFFDTHGHGTHVSGIIGAYGGPGERLNGLAPGVELVAIKIGDGKYGGATSGFSIAKALDYAVEAGCKVANISFGGPSFFADGREPDAWILDEATRRGLIVVTSAGNEGPTLSTVGAPGTSRSAIAVAAAVWPDTQKVNYGSIRPVDPVLFDFSSRGPLPTGDLGIDFTAPGAALSTLPSWLITPAENFNGTSMAAPQVTGSVALLVSAAVAEQLPAQPARVYHALRLGARPLAGFAWVEQGHGVVNVPAAYEALRELSSAPAERRYTVEVANPFGTGGGIYERDLPSTASFERTVRVAPVFAEDESNAVKAAFLETFRIQAEDSWLSVPEAVYLTQGGRSFPVQIRPRGLRPGLHSSRVLLFDADRDESAGPELVVPVTVVVPLETKAAEGHRLHERFELKPGELKRTFVRVPYGATQARIVLTQDGAGRNEFRTGAGSVSAFRFSGERQARGRIFLEDGERNERSVPVEAGTVFEYTVASRWSVNRPVRLQLELEFVGVVPQTAPVIVPAGQGFAYLALKSPLRAENLAASGRIEGLAYPVGSPMRIVPDPIRSTVFGGRGMFQGIVEWELQLNEKADVAVRTPGSIQTTEYREDLMLEVVDATGRVSQRQILSEIETGLGEMEPGRYTLRFLYTALGQESLEGRYAGVEVRVKKPQHTLKLYGELKDAFQDTDASGRLDLPFGGGRTLIARLPDLPDLTSGGYYFGAIELKRDRETILEVPLRVVRSAAEGAPVDAAPEDPAADARAAYDEALAQADRAPGLLLEKARAWAKADPRSAEAELATLQALVSEGYPARARQQAVDFLRRFPGRAEDFFRTVEGWPDSGT